MKIPNRAASPSALAPTNGSGAAAILAAGIGCFALAVLACAGDKLADVKNSLIFYKPTGPLSGVTTPGLPNPDATSPGSSASAKSGGAFVAPSSLGLDLQAVSGVTSGGSK